MTVLKDSVSRGIVTTVDFRPRGWTSRCSSHLVVTWAVGPWYVEAIVDHGPGGRTRGNRFLEKGCRVVGRGSWNMKFPF